MSLIRVSFLNGILSEVDHAGRFVRDISELIVNLTPPVRKFFFAHLMWVKCACLIVVYTHHLLQITRASDDPCRLLPPWSQYPAQVSHRLQVTHSRMQSFRYHVLAVLVD